MIFMPRGLLGAVYWALYRWWHGVPWPGTDQEGRAMSAWKAAAWPLFLLTGLAAVVIGVAEGNGKLVFGGFAIMLGGLVVTQ